MSQPVGEVTQIIELLETNLYPGEKGKVEVIPWIDQKLVYRRFLEKNVYQFIITVRKLDVQTGHSRRSYNLRSLSELVVFQVAVWAKDNPSYFEKTKYVNRDALVRKLRVIFANNRLLGKVRLEHNADTMLQQSMLLCTQLTVTQVIEGNRYETNQNEIP